MGFSFGLRYYVDDDKTHTAGVKEEEYVQLKDAEGVTERLKAENQMEWVGRMNSIRSRAEEVVLSELVYC